MAITCIAPASLSGTTDSTTLNITLPTVQVGDVMVLEYTHRGTGTGTLGGAGGSGWTNKFSRTYATATFSAHCYYKRCDGSESGDALTVTGLTNSCAGCVTLYRGVVASGDPIEAGTAEDNASGDESHATISSLTAGAWIVLTVANSPDVAVTSPNTTSPGALTQRAERLNATGTDTSICHNSAEKASAGATGSLTWAQTNGPSASFAYALQPAPADLSKDVPAESLKVDDIGQGTTELVSAGAIHITDGPPVAELVTVGGDLSRAVADDSLKISDSVTAALTSWSTTVAQENLKVSDSVTARLDAWFVTVASESLKVSDAVTLALTPWHAAPASEALKISDSVTARLDSWSVAVASESLKLSDSVTAGLTLLEVSVVSESLRLSDSVSAVSDLLAPVIATESLKVSDVVTAAIDAWFVTVAPESLKVDDQEPPLVSFLADLSIEIPAEALKVSDIVTAALDAWFIEVTAESLKVDDQEPPAVVLVLEGELSVNVAAESLKVDDIGQGTTQLFGVIHVVDLAPVAELIGEGISVASESIRISESLTVIRDPLDAPALTETLHLVDAVDSWAELVQYEGLAVVDQAPIAQLTTLVTDLSREVTSESLKLADTVTAGLTPLQVSLSEALRLSDSVTASLGNLIVQLTESLRVSDSVQAGISPLQAAPGEAIEVTDSLTAYLTPLGVVAAAEALRLSDQVTAILSPLGVSLTESLRVADMVSTGSTLPVMAAETLRLADTVTAGLTPLHATASEALRLADTVTAGLTPLAVSLTESLKVSDAVTAARDLAASPSEALRLSESLTARIPELTVSLTETLHLADVLTVVVTPLHVSLTEALELSDADLTIIRAEYGGLLVDLTETLHISDTAPDGLLPSDLTVSTIYEVESVDRVYRVPDHERVYTVETVERVYRVPSRN